MPVEDFIVVRYSFSGAEIHRVTAGDPDYMIPPATAHSGYSGAGNWSTLAPVTPIHSLLSSSLVARSITTVSVWYFTLRMRDNQLP